jgi:hypothetical protein
MAFEARLMIEYGTLDVSEHPKTRGHRNSVSTPSLDVDRISYLESMATDKRHQCHLVRSFLGASISHKA